MIHWPWQRVIIVMSFVTGAVVLSIFGHDTIAVSLATAASALALPPMRNGNGPTNK